MTALAERRIGRYPARPARRADADGARSVMLDTFHHVFGHGYTPTRLSKAPEPFWRGIAEEIHDGRTDPRYSPAVHFEMSIQPV